MKDTGILVTLGPSSFGQGVISQLSEMGVSLFRINLSHTDVKDLRTLVAHIRKSSTKHVPICFDSEGAQVRTSKISTGTINVNDNSYLRISKKKVPGDYVAINLVPSTVVDDLVVGDFISIDFNSVLSRVISKDSEGATIQILNGGKIGENKAVTIERDFPLPAYSEKDLQAFEIAKELNIEYVALSFAHLKEDVTNLREILGKDIKIISKIECKSGIENLDSITEMSDEILIDRGDLSREVSIERIPKIQTRIIETAKRLKTPVNIATNLLESMIESPSPTRAEANDIYKALTEGANGLVLAAETAVGKYPLQVVSFVIKVIEEYKNQGGTEGSFKYFFDEAISFLPSPHGGKLIESLNPEKLSIKDLDLSNAIEISEEDAIDVEQICTGVYSPIEGFFTKSELESVLSDLKMPNGVSWPMPMLLQVEEKVFKGSKNGERLYFKYEGRVHSYIDLKESYQIDLNEVAKKWYGTDDDSHPGVKRLFERGRFCLSGKVSLLAKKVSEFDNVTMTPRESRFVLNKKGWVNVVGFHTRNVPHLGHEFIQKKALERVNADGLLLSPVIGPKKAGDFLPEPIIRSYQELINFGFLPKNKSILSPLVIYPRYAGPREALFTAICRQNMGCNYFIIGRDHAGVGEFYKGINVEEFFKENSEDLVIKPLFFKEVAFLEEKGRFEEIDEDNLSKYRRISGTELRGRIDSNSEVPEWLVRDIIWSGLRDLKNENKDIFC